MNPTSEIRSVTLPYSGVSLNNQVCKVFVFRTESPIYTTAKHGHRIMRVQRFEVRTDDPEINNPRLFFQLLIDQAGCIFDEFHLCSVHFCESLFVFLLTITWVSVFKALMHMSRNSRSESSRSGWTSTLIRALLRCE